MITEELRAAGRAAIAEAVAAGRLPARPSAETFALLADIVTAQGEPDFANVPSSASAAVGATAALAEDGGASHDPLH